MAAAGVAARRACESIIAEGVVKVNGQQVLSQVLVDPARDVIEVRGQPLNTKKMAERLYYFAINKPKGYICSTVDQKAGASTAAQQPPGKGPLGQPLRVDGRRAIDLLQPWLEAWSKQPTNKGLLPPRFFTVGRLDVATTGLLFVTNDGKWANRVIHPSSDLTKEYVVLVDKAPSKVQLETMMRGVEVDGMLVQPEEVSTLAHGVRLRVVVKEGKKHEVRLLAAAAGLEVLALKRVRVGGFRMPYSLRLGAYMALEPHLVVSVTDPRAQQAASAKPPSEQRGPSRAQRRGLPSAEEVQAMLVVDKAPVAHKTRGRAPGRRRAKERDDE